MPALLGNFPKNLPDNLLGSGPRRTMIGRFARFARCERGVAAIEGALALSVLVVAFVVQMNIVTDIYTEDQAGRGARVVARAIALNADPWAALRKEFGLDENHSCNKLTDNTPGACDGWTLSIARKVSPKSLGDALGGTATSGGDMVLVRLWKGQGGTKTPDAIGLARGEPEA